MFLKREVIIKLTPMKRKRKEIAIIPVMVTGFYSSTRKSQDDTCPILYVLPLSLLVAPAILSAGQNSRCVKSVTKLVPRVVKDEENFGQSYSSGAPKLSNEIVID